MLHQHDAPMQGLFEVVEVTVNDVVDYEFRPVTPDPGSIFIEGRVLDPTLCWRCGAPRSPSFD